MKFFTHHIVAFVLMSCTCFPALAQFRFLDSSKEAFHTQPSDTSRIITGLNISYSYVVLDPDSALCYALQCVALAKKEKDERWLFYSEEATASAHSALGNYPEELACCFKARALARKRGDPHELAGVNELLSDYYYNLGEFKMSRQYMLDIKCVAEKICPNATLPIWMGLAKIYEGMQRPDSAIRYAEKAVIGLKGNPYHLEGWQIGRVQSMTSWILGHAFSQLGMYDSAMFWYRQGLPISYDGILKLDLAEQRVGMARAFRATNRLDSAMIYARLVLDDTLSKTYPAGRLKALTVLGDIFESRRQPDSAVKYMRLAMNVKDSLFNRQKMVAIQSLATEEQERLKNAEAQNIRATNRFWILLLVGVFILVLLVALVVLRWQRLKQLQKMRNSIADDLHDDIGSTLSSISIMSELAKVKSPEALPLLTSIEESALSLQENMSDIVWAVNPKNDRFENLLQRMNAFASEILDARKIGLDFKSDPALDPARLSMGQRKNLYLFFKEAINNAAKYSGASRVCVSIGRQDNRVVMQISDDGRGFDTTRNANGHGMLTLKKRREELGGEMRIDSWPGRGTDVGLRFRIT